MLDLFTERSKNHENEAKHLYKQIKALKRKRSDQRVLEGKIKNGVMNQDTDQSKARDHTEHGELQTSLEEHQSALEQVISKN